MISVVRVLRLMQYIWRIVICYAPSDLDQSPGRVRTRVKFRAHEQSVGKQERQRATKTTMVGLCLFAARRLCVILYCRCAVVGATLSVVVLANKIDFRQI